MTTTHERGELIFAVQRNDCRSELLTDFLNTFGRQGGFESVLKRIQEKRPDANELVLVSAIVECFAKSAPMFHR